MKTHPTNNSNYILHSFAAVLDCRPVHKTQNWMITITCGNVCVYTFDIKLVLYCDSKYSWVASNHTRRVAMPGVLHTNSEHVRCDYIIPMHIHIAIQYTAIRYIIYYTVLQYTMYCSTVQYLHDTVYYMHICHAKWLFEKRNTCMRCSMMIMRMPCSFVHSILLRER